ncbi:GNAT domain-containing protein [Mycena rosella]|uniref:GNAT domain-containing protein n=1 Tax=Mycena rosella TaxID=1033263 RepID=A0AAD7FVS0_MYCRO|nr:GNAT domain-containing protein [Mycena rosella]
MHTRSARLTLREYTSDDVEAVYALDSIPDVARYQTWPPRTRAEAKEFVDWTTVAAADVPRVSVSQAVSITAPPENAPPRNSRPTRSMSKDSTSNTVIGTGPFIGSVGGQIDIGARTAELFYSFMPSARAQGYATEAVEALIGMLSSESERRSVPPFDRLIIQCDPRNVRSSRLAERMGFVLESYTEKDFECKREWVGVTLRYSRKLDMRIGSVHRAGPFCSAYWNQGCHPLPSAAVVLRPVDSDF